MNLLLLSEQDVDNITSTAKVKLLVYMQWSDPRLAGRVGGQRLPPRLWSPRLRLSEGRADMSVTTLEFALREWDANARDGDLYCLDLYEGSINNDMDLQRFPFDTDNIEITFLGSQCALRDGTIRNQRKSDYRIIAPWEHGVVGEEKMDIPEWKWIFTTTEYLKTNPDDSNDHSRDVFRINIVVTRNTKYYMTKIITPLLLITTLNFMVFYVPIEDLADRLAHITTLFLSRSRCCT